MSTNPAPPNFPRSEFPEITTTELPPVPSGVLPPDGPTPTIPDPNGPPPTPEQVEFMRTETARFKRRTKWYNEAAELMREKKGHERWLVQYYERAEKSSRANLAWWRKEKLRVSSGRRETKEMREKRMQMYAAMEAAEKGLREADIKYQRMQEIEDWLIEGRKAMGIWVHPDALFDR
ncbi:hypothetical protein ACMFMF_005748 [Clarireedia jacksonii]